MYNDHKVVRQGETTAKENKKNKRKFRIFLHMYYRRIYY